MFVVLVAKPSLAQVTELGHYVKYALASYGFIYANSGVPMQLPEVVCRVTGVAAEDILYVS
jgi:hypothetical protein